MNLQIQCPECRRRFQGTNELIGKTVECGACDHRFVVEEAKVIRERKKFYPGEHQDAGLEIFGRSPTKEEVPVTFQTAQYEVATDFEQVQPATPAQNFAVITGMGLILFYAIIFSLTTGKGQAFTDIDFFSRILLGAFIATVSSALMIYGAKTWRKKAVLVSIILAAGLLGLIFICPVHTTPNSFSSDFIRPTGPMVFRDSAPEQSDFSSEEEQYLKKIGYRKVKDAFERFQDTKTGVTGRKLVAAIYAHPANDVTTNKLERYLRRKLKLPDTSPIHKYHRNKDQDRLIVITGVEIDLDELANFCELMGKVSPPLVNRRLIDIQIDLTKFSAPSPEESRKLNDPSHELFCLSNLDELGDFDLDRVTSAVRRLATMPEDATMRRKPEITERLVYLLKTELDRKLLDTVGTALKKWGDDPSVVNQVSEYAVNITDDNDLLERSVVEYLIDYNGKNILSIVDSLWARNPIRWSSHYASLGNKGEDRLLFHVQNSPVELRESALEILRAVGTQKSISVLRALQVEGDDGFDILKQRAIDSILARD